MPVIHTKTIRTMREIWDKEKKIKTEKKHEKKECARQQAIHFLGKNGENLFQGRFRLKEKQFVKIRKCYLEHLELKKAVLDFFPEYEKYLGDAGFLKI